MFLLNQFVHLRKHYKTAKEFEQHLFSGEVKVSIKDLETIMNQKAKWKQPSHQNYTGIKNALVATKQGKAPRQKTRTKGVGNVVAS